MNSFFEIVRTDSAAREGRAGGRFALALAAVGWASVAASAAPPPPPAAAATAGEVLLLNFNASWCGPCRQMDSIVAEVAAAGWVVRSVDVDSETDLVRRFGVTGVPCYVLLVKGHEAGRINGATTRAELERLLAASAVPLGGKPLPPPTAIPAAEPGIPLPVKPAAAPLAIESPSRSAEPVLPAERGVSRGAPAAVAEAVSPVAAIAPAASEPPRDALERTLMAATARLRVESAAGVSRGTGTVIDCRQGEALILTCGHIFRDSAGKGQVEVDLFAPGGPRGVAGQVVAWDLRRDLALVSIFTDAPLEAVRVGTPDRRVGPGESVVTVGCNGGADPTIHHSRITAVDKYLGPANVQVAGQPVQGRSGGGLFAIDGTLIGVCNAADPADNEGLFAALPSIHEQLEEAGLAFVYRNVYPSAGADALAAGGSAHVPAMPDAMPPVSFDRRDRADALPTASTNAVVPPATPAGTPTVPGPAPVAPKRALAAAAPPPLSPGEQALLEHVRRHEGKAEVICIVRPHDAVGNASEVFVLNNAATDFVDHLARVHHGTPDPPGGVKVAELPTDAARR